MKFLGQHFQKLEHKHDRQTQTDRQLCREQNFLSRSQVIISFLACEWYLLSIVHCSLNILHLSSTLHHARCLWFVTFNWCIKLKLASLTFKATLNEVPPYLSRLLIPCRSSHVLRSSFPAPCGLRGCKDMARSGAIDCLEILVSVMTYSVSSGTLNHTHSLTHSSFSSNLLQVPRTNLIFSSRSFRAAAPTVWYSLPDNIRSSNTFNSFQHHLKTHYFQAAFNTP